MTLTELIIRITTGFLVLFTLARLLGRKEISQVTFFNFVSAIAIGSVAANLVINQSLSIRDGVIALIGWSLFTLLMDFIDLNSKKLRKIVSGMPIVVIRDGQILYDSLRSVRLDLDSLTAMLRQQGIFSLSIVDYAILENNGNLSVMLKQHLYPVNKTDMNIPLQSKVIPIPTEVISDGKILTQNLIKLNYDQNWLEGQLKLHNINSVTDVLFAQVQMDGALLIHKKDNGLKT